MGVSRATFEYGLANKHKAHSRHALHALSARGDQCIEMNCSRINFQRRERTHRIDDEPLTVTLADLAHGLQRIQHASARFAMYQTDVRDRRIRFQFRIKFVRGNGFVFGAFQNGGAAAH